LLAFLDHSIAEKFSKNEARSQLMVAKSVEEVLTLLENIDRTSMAIR
jgi:mannitol/fructose-specific phosphotransferase system IIA component (Ntr-type)